MSKPIDPRDLWIDDHLSDAALGALADGQIGVVPDDACSHAETRPSCSERLAVIATSALEIDHAMARLVADRLRQSRRFPFALVVAALALAGIGAAPSLADRTANAASLLGSLPQIANHVFSVAGTLAASLSHGPLAPILTFGVFAVLALSGLIVSRGSRRRGVMS